MKQILTIFMSLCMLLTLSFTSKAQMAVETNSKVEYLGNGFYSSINVEIFDSYSARGANTRTATKTYELLDSDGNLNASFALVATFTYNGSYVECTSASYSSNINKSGWQFTEESSSYDGNIAYGNFTAVYTWLGIKIQTVTETVTLTCDVYGNIS